MCVVYTSVAAMIIAVGSGTVVVWVCVRVCVWMLTIEANMTSQQQNSMVAECNYTSLLNVCVCVCVPFSRKSQLKEKTELSETRNTGKKLVQPHKTDQAFYWTAIKRPSPYSNLLEILMQKILCQDFGGKANKGVQNIQFVQLQLLLRMYPLLHVARVQPAHNTLSKWALNVTSHLSHSFSIYLLCILLVHIVFLGRGTHPSLICQHSS